MSEPRYPSLYQVNTRVWLTELSQRLGRRATLDDIPSRDLDQIAEQGFDWIWLLSVWQTGNAGRLISRSNPVWRHGFEQALPDLSDADIEGSGFAITGYQVHPALGGEIALTRLRGRLRRLGIKLMLDFVPNHLAIDHPWVAEHPEYFVTGNEADLLREPKNFFEAATSHGVQVFAHGRDPNFPGWPDTVQLNYANPDVHEAMTGELCRVARQCDGVRCDMAMLLLPEIFQRTWGTASPPFWPDALQKVRQVDAGFVLLAEVYWDLEWTLQQQGFNYCYDKRLYDRLRSGQAMAVRQHFVASLDYQDHLARFLENHDESRAAATFPPAMHRAAALLTFLAPGLRFLHEGQLEGRRIHVSTHLVRAPVEPADFEVAAFYDRLLAVLRQGAVRDGRWWLLDSRPAWTDNETHDSIIAFAWERSASERLIVVVNYSDHASQARIPFPFPYLPAEIHLQELIGTESFDRSGREIESLGLYVDLPPWGSHVLAVSSRPS